MLYFMGETIIERQIAMYRKCGISDIIVVRGFAADKILYEGIKYYTNEEYANTNMVESLLCAKQEFDDDVIVSYSDILFEERLLKGMMASDVYFACGVDDNWKVYWQQRYGKIEFDTESLSVDENDNITELGLENPKLEDIDARYIGILKFSKVGLQYIMDIMNEAYKLPAYQPWQQSGKVVKKAYMTDLLNAIIESGRQVKAVHFNNGWIEFDTNEDYENATEWVKTGEIEKIIKY